MALKRALPTASRLLFPRPAAARPPRPRRVASMAASSQTAYSENFYQPMPAPPLQRELSWEENFPNIALSSRVRKSPFFHRMLEHGAEWTTYNHMLMPLGFGDPQREYDALCNDVAIWDVAAERQVELRGPDAAKLAQLLTCRSLKGMKVGSCRYAIMSNSKGEVINDPVLLKLAEDRFWFSIADSDVLLWAEAHATARGLDVEVFEPDVSPLALQGPRSRDLVRELFEPEGVDVDAMKYFNCVETQLGDIPVVLARSGWSPELGFELYLQDETRGGELFDMVWEAGVKHGIHPGAPNHLRRIEGGMVSFRADTLPDTNALELGLPKRMVNLDMEADFIGKEALRRVVRDGGPRRTMVGLVFDDLDVSRPPYWSGQHLPLEHSETGEDIGRLTSVAGVSKRVGGKSIAMGVLKGEHFQPGKTVGVRLADGSWSEARLDTLPFEERKA